MRPQNAVPFLLWVLTSLVGPAAAQTPGELPPLYAASDDAALGADIAARLEALAQAPVPAGADMAVLFEHRAMMLGPEGMTTHLDGAVALLPPHTGGLAYRVPLPFQAEIGEVAAWIRRADGGVSRLAETDIARESDPLSDRPFLILATPDAGPGDVVGWSTAFTSEGLAVRALHPSRAHFVAESVYRWITPDIVSYTLTIERPTPGDIVQTLASGRGRPSDQSAHFTDLPPLGSAPFGRPDVRQPALLITAVGSYVEQISRWMVMETWPPMAQFIGGTVTAFTTDIPVTASVARQAVKDDDSDRIKMLKLQRLVSRQLATIPTTDFGNPSESSDEALGRKAATPRMKALLLLAMAREVGLDVDLVLARDNRLGPLDDAHPSLAQFTDALVRLNGDMPLDLTPDDRYPADALPFHLLGSPAAVAVDDAVDKVQLAFMQMAMSNKPSLDFGAEPPLTLFRLPGDPDTDERAQQTETVTWNDEREAAVRLEAIGETDLFLAYRSKTPPADLLRDHLAAAFPGLAFTPGEIAAGKPKSAVNPMHLVVRGPVTVDATVPAPDGEIWTLPAATVYGAPTAAGWPLNADAPFFVAGRTTSVRTWSHPLPKGWKDVQAPPTLEFGNEWLEYRAEVSAADGLITVTRTVTFRPCNLPAGRTGPLRTLLERARSFETSPLHLEKR